jgi:two-component system response regulator AtoC
MMFARDVELLVPEAMPAGVAPTLVGGSSPAMLALERVIVDIAPTNIPVLLLGESGTGKEVVAMRIHGLSRQAQQPFHKLSCAALTPETLNGSNGHNGHRDRWSGSLFLDEISELDAQCQPKLLHLLPEGAAANTRIIAATRRSLEEEMHAGRFREELYYRLNGVCLRLPPLRHRREDIPALVEHFLACYAEQFGRPRPRLRSHTLRLLQEHAWPGNVRELENVIKKIVALGDESLALADLGGMHAEPAPGNGNGNGHGNGAHAGVSLKQAARAASRQAERELILRVLARTRWNRKRAAQELQISYKALLYKLKQIGLEDSAVC